VVQALAAEVALERKRGSDELTSASRQLIKSKYAVRRLRLFSPPPPLPIPTAGFLSRSETGQPWCTTHSVQCVLRVRSREARRWKGSGHLALWLTAWL